MKRVIIIVLICIFCFSCNNNAKPDKPKDLIPETQFSDILFDMNVVNSAKGVNKKILEDNGIVPLDYIFKKHNIDSLQFANSNSYYAFDIERYTKILSRVQNKAQAEKDIYDAQLKAKEAIRAKKQDSIKAVSIRIRDSIAALNKEVNNSTNADIRLDLQ